VVATGKKKRCSLDKTGILLRGNFPETGCRALFELIVETGAFSLPAVFKRIMA
jgi:hypothetical protein